MRIFKKIYASGFSLVELSIVLVIAGFVLVSVMTTDENVTGLKKKRDVHEQMEVIQGALEKHFQQFSYYPCPANGSLISSHANFGRGVRTAPATASDTCDTTGLLTDGGSVIMGVVPIKELALPASMMIDPWGNRIGYAVIDEAARLGGTPASFITIYKDFDDNVDSGDLVANTAGQDVGDQESALATYVLISYGADGIGAYPEHGDVDEDAPRNEPDLNGSGDRIDSFDQMQNHHMDYGASFPLDNVFLKPSVPVVSEQSPNATIPFDDIVLYGEGVAAPTGCIGDTADYDIVTAPNNATATSQPQLIAWFDATVICSIQESGGVVSAWADLSRNFEDPFTGGTGAENAPYIVSQATASNQPITNGRTINSLNTIEFDGDDGLVGGDYIDRIPDSNSTIGQPMTIFVIAERDTIPSGTGNRSYLYDNSQSANVWAFTKAGNYAINSGSTLNTSLAAAVNTPELHTHIFDAGSSKYFVDGDLKAESGAGSGDMDGIVIGLTQNASSNTGLDGLIGEIIIYNGLLSDSERQNIELYLMTKWGLLPSCSNGTASLPNISSGGDLVLWLDATDTCSIITETPISNVVQEWQDKSGNEYHASQSTSSKRPLSETRTSNNGNNVVDFAGNDALTTTSFDSSHRSQAHTVFVVAKRDSVTSNRRNLFDGLSSTTRHRAISDSNQKYAMHAGSTVVSDFDARTLEELHSLIFDGASSTYYVQQDDIATGDAGSQSLDGMAIGSDHNTSGDFLDGWIGEVIVYDNVVNDSDRDTIETYLINKWNLTASSPDPCAGGLPVLVNLVAHFDSCDSSGSVVTSGGKVMEWRDEVGGHHVYSTDPSRWPDYGSRFQNGIPVVDFDGSTDYLREGGTTSSIQPPAPFNLEINDGSREVTIIVVSKRDNLRGAVISRAGAAGDEFSLYNDSSSNRMFVDFNGGHADTTVNTHNNPTIQTLFLDGSNSRFFEGNSSNNFSLNAGFLSGITIGAGNNAERKFNGWIGEVIIYEERLTTIGDDEHQQVLDYLSEKWDIPL